MATSTDNIEQLANQDYKYGFVTDIDAEAVPPGLNEEVIRVISAKKGEPEIDDVPPPLSTAAPAGPTSPAPPRGQPVIPVSGALASGGRPPTESPLVHRSTRHTGALAVDRNARAHQSDQEAPASAGTP